MTKLTRYQWRKMDENRWHDDLRYLWTLVTECPGISLRKIASEMGITFNEARVLVDLLVQSGTLTKGEKYKAGTLRAPVPMIRVEMVETSTGVYRVTKAGE